MQTSAIAIAAAIAPREPSILDSVRRAAKALYSQSRNVPTEIILPKAIYDRALREGVAMNGLVRMDDWPSPGDVTLLRAVV